MIHPRDKYITFDEETHTYFLNGKPISTSVTEFIHSFFSSFNPDTIIEKWYEIWQSNPNSKYYGLSKEQIKELWEQHGKQASELGSQLHKTIEEFYMESKPITQNDREYLHFKQFHEDFGSELIPIRSEWMVYDEELDLAGSIDMVFQTKEHEFIIVDWKRSKEIKEQSQDMGLYPVSHLPNANYWHYSLQLNMYKYILEKHYDQKVSQLKLVVLHPNNDSYQIIPVGTMQKEIEDLVKERLYQLNLQLTQKPQN
jgi:CRISPR/Cas system-associated exonuclease Cas4 (RecB family)